MDSCKGLIAAFNDVIKAQRNFSQAFTGLIEAQDCHVEKEILKEVQAGTGRALPLFSDIVTTLHNAVLEPLQLLEIETMSVAASLISDIHKMTPKSGKKYFQSHKETISDWNAFRQIRHDMLLSSIYHYSQFATQQVNLLTK